MLNTNEKLLAGLNVVIVSPFDVAATGLRMMLEEDFGCAVIQVCRSSESLVSFGMTNAVKVDLAIIDEDADLRNNVMTPWVQLIPGLESARVVMMTSHPVTPDGCYRIDKCMEKLDIFNVLTSAVEARIGKHIDAFSESKAVPDALVNNDIIARLTPTEQGVISGLLLGMTVSDMATRCGKSVKTISGQKQSALRKMQFKNMIGLYNYFYSIRPKIVS